MIKYFYKIPLLIFFVSIVVFSLAKAQRRGGPPPSRAHTVTQSSGKLKLVQAIQMPVVPSDVSIQVEGDERVIRANGIPYHSTGAFPNRGNPHEIEIQSYEYRIPAHPETARRTTPLGMHNFGIAVNGVPFDPGAAEWYLGDRSSIWQYEPLSGAIGLGIDMSHAHVQPTGAYHYHGLPKGLFDSIKLRASAHSPIVGWAADGFPIYALYGYSDAGNSKSKIKAMKSSYRLKVGRRPSGRDQPGGNYDGTFVADFEYVKGYGDLDENNGRVTITPEFPDGTYAYFLTETWPVIPRSYRGTPSRDFMRRGGSPGLSGGRRPPPPRR